MKVGDLVYARHDLERGFRCLGIILEVSTPSTRGDPTGVQRPWKGFRVMWSSESGPIGWWNEEALEAAIGTG